MRKAITSQKPMQQAIIMDQGAKKDGKPLADV